jgi:hypothetical protein
VSVWERIKEIDRFFQGTSSLHDTMNRLAGQLESADIDYAVMGGMAVNAHGHRQTTDDVGILLTPEGLKRFRDRFVGRHFDPSPGLPRRFLDRANGETLNVYVTGRFPGNGEPGPIVYPDPAAVRERISNVAFVNLLTLIQLNLANRWFQDLADVVSLIRVHQLDESFLDRLHPSVRKDFIECLEEKRRQEEYEARQ